MPRQKEKRPKRKAQGPCRATRAGQSASSLLVFSPGARPEAEAVFWLKGSFLNGWFCCKMCNGDFLRLCCNPLVIVRVKS